MNISDNILRLKNKIRAKVLLEVSTEGNASEWKYPEKCNIINKKTGEKWSVEFHSKPYNDPDGISPTEWYAELKDNRGKSLEKKDIYRYFGEKTLDRIDFKGSGYGPIWNSVNIEFKKFQMKYRRIRDKEAKMRHDANAIPAMQKLGNFLKKQK